MAKVGSIQKSIRRVEGFEVRFLHPDGRDVRDDRMQIPAYPYERALKNRANVRAWIDRRFLRSYPGFLVKVLNADGTRAHGNTRLSTVRDTYLDD